MAQVPPLRFPILLFAVLALFGCGRPVVYHLTVSPDGKEIAFTVKRPILGTASIFAVNIKSQSVREISPPDLDSWVPKYSPDGAWITFVGSPRHIFDDFHRETKRLFIMKSDGSNPEALTEGDPPDWWPIFSPDMSEIYFVRPYIFESTGRRWWDHQLFAVNLEDREVRLVALTQFWRFGSMVISPDGARILVGAYQGRKTIYDEWPIIPNTLSQLNLKGFGGFNTVYLHWGKDSDKSRNSGRLGDWGIREVSFIPGENALLGSARHYTGGQKYGATAKELFRVDLDTGEIDQITDLGLELYYPTYRADGNSILCTDLKEIIQLDRDGTSPRIVLTDPGLRSSLGMPRMPDEEKYFRPQYPRTFMSRVGRWFTR